mgnify:CR=1 FL=1
MIVLLKLTLVGLVVLLAVAPLVLVFVVATAPAQDARATHRRIVMDRIPKRCPECKIMPEVTEQLEEELVDIVVNKQYIDLTAREGRELRITLLNELREFFKQLMR